MSKGPAYRIKVCKVDTKRWTEIGAVWLREDGSISFSWGVEPSANTFDRDKYIMKGFPVDDDGRGSARSKPVNLDVPDEDIPF